MKHKFLSVALVVLGLCVAPVAAWANDAATVAGIINAHHTDLVAIPIPNPAHIGGDTVWVTSTNKVTMNALSLTLNPGVSVAWHANTEGTTAGPLITVTGGDTFWFDCQIEQKGTGGVISSNSHVLVNNVNGNFINEPIFVKAASGSTISADTVTVNNVNDPDKLAATVTVEATSGTAISAVRSVTLSGGGRTTTGVSISAASGVAIEAATVNVTNMATVSNSGGVTPAIWITGRGLRVDGAEADLTVTGNVALTGTGSDVYAANGGTLHITGNVTGNANFDHLVAVAATGSGSALTIDGNLTTSGVGAGAWNGGTVTINGDVIADGRYGADCYNGGRIYIQGTLTVNDDNQYIRFLDQTQTPSDYYFVPKRPYPSTQPIGGIDYHAYINNLVTTFAPAYVYISVPLTSVTFTGAVSRKEHRTAVGVLVDTFDLPISAVGAVTVEPRTGGPNRAFEVVFQFDGEVVGIASATLAEGGAGINHTTTPNGREVSVRLTNVPDGRQMRITLTVDGVAAPISANIGFLSGKVSGGGVVNQTDVTGVRTHVGAMLSEDNFIYDLDTDGTINQTDVTSVRTAVGQVLQ